MSEQKKEIHIPLDEIPVNGALGLLALGDVGVRLWREARQKKMKELNLKKEQANNEQKES